MAGQHEGLRRAPRPVYLDYAATTPVAPEVAQAMHGCLTSDGAFGNAASSGHSYGRAALAIVESARADVAQLIGAEPANVLFTSGATEADNLAILGTAAFRDGPPGHIVTSRVEHKAVVDSIGALTSRGWTVTWVDPGPGGRVDAGAIEAALRPDTAIVAVMLVNNELGTIQPVAEIGALLAEHDAVFVVDAAQAAGRVDIDVGDIGADFVTLSAHKCYGPKGVGALWFAGRYAPPLAPLMFGGGHERGVRPGTPPTHQIAGFGRAAELAIERRHADTQRITALSTRLVDGLLAVPGVRLNGADAPRVPHIVNVHVDGVDGESLRFAMEPVAVSGGSACTSALAEPSAVLRAIGLTDDEAESSLRFSLGRETDANDVELAVRQFRSAVEHLRSMAAFVA